MKKNSNILKRLVAVVAIALAFVNLIVPRQADLDADAEAGITVCVIENDGEEEGRPLDDPDFI